MCVTVTEFNHVKRDELAHRYSPWYWKSWFHLFSLKLVTMSLPKVVWFVTLLKI